MINVECEIYKEMDRETRRHYDAMPDYSYGVLLETDHADKVSVELRKIMGCPVHAQGNYVFFSRHLDDDDLTKLGDYSNDGRISSAKVFKAPYVFFPKDPQSLLERLLEQKC